MICSNCGARTEARFSSNETSFCANCGGALRPDPSEGLPTKKDPRSTILFAALLGFFVMGCGHFGLKRVGRGLAFLIVGLVTMIMFFISYFGAFFEESPMLTILFGGIWLILWILQIVDATYLMRKYNEGIETLGHPPW